MHSSNQALTTALSRVLVHATELGRMFLQVVELPPVELVSNGTIAAQDIKACDEKVDIWALGVTLFELLTGKPASFLSPVIIIMLMMLVTGQTQSSLLMCYMHEQVESTFAVSMIWDLSSILP